MVEDVTLTLYLIPIAFLLWLFFWPYRRYRLALLRQQLFSLRDLLFKYALSRNGFDFSSRAYGMTRTTLNGILRFADELSLVDLLVQFCLLSKASEDEKALRHKRIRERQLALADLSAQDRELVEKIMVAAHGAVFAYVASTSLLLAPLFHLMRAVFKVAELTGAVREKSLRLRSDMRDKLLSLDAVQAFDTEAEAMGAVIAPMKRAA